MTRRQAKRGTVRLWVVTVTLLAIFTLAAPVGGQPVAGIVIWFLGFNTTLPPFSDVLARRAVATALDRARLAAADNNNLANGVEPPGCLAYNPAARVPAYNPQRARDFLAQSGFKSDEFGELGLWVLSALRRGDSQKELEILSANLAAIGLQVTVREFGNYAAFDRIATLPVVRMSYWGLRWNTAGCAQGTFLEDLAHSKGEFNRFGYRNPEVDALIDRAQAAGDRQTRIRLFQEAEQKILDDAVIVPMWWYAIP